MYNENINILFDDISIWGFLESVYSVHTGAMGETVFWLIILPSIFLAMVIKQQSTTVPVILYLSLGSMLMLVAPPQLHMAAFLMLVLSITGILYGMLRNRY